MKDQHTKIKGYRDLSQVEIDLMNAVKEKAEEVAALIASVVDHVDKQITAATSKHIMGRMSDEEVRLAKADPFKWVLDAKLDLQTGFMKLVRSVAQPTSF